MLSARAGHNPAAQISVFLLPSSNLNLFLCYLCRYGLCLARISAASLWSLLLLLPSPHLLYLWHVKAHLYRSVYTVSCCCFSRLHSMLPVFIKRLKMCYCCCHCLEIPASIVRSWSSSQKHVCLLPLCRNVCCDECDDWGRDRATRP